MSFRIVHIDTETGWRGGENQALLLARGLRERGHSNLIIGQPRSEWIRRAREEGFETQAIRMRGEWDLLARFHVRRAVQRFDAHIVHAHTSHAHAMALAAASPSAATPHIIVSRRVDFAIGENFASRRKYLNPACDYIAISHGVRNALVAGGVESDRIRIVHSGIDPNRFTGQADGAAFRKEMGCVEGDILIGNVGALTDHKGHTYLIEAARRLALTLPNLRFCIVGEGELRAALQAQIDEARLTERFQLAGFREDIESCLAAFDLFVLSSHLEGLCTSLIDAMFLGVPVVATAVGGVPDLVRDGQTGLLAPPRDPQSLADSIRSLLDSADRGQRLASHARQWARENFTAKRMVDGIEAAYRAIVSR